MLRRRARREGVLGLKSEPLSIDLSISSSVSSAADDLKISDGSLVGVLDDTSDMLSRPTWLLRRGRRVLDEDEGDSDSVESSAEIDSRMDVIERRVLSADLSSLPDTDGGEMELRRLVAEVADETAVQSDRAMLE